MSAYVLEIITIMNTLLPVECRDFFAQDDVVAAFDSMWRVRVRTQKGRRVRVLLLEPFGYEFSTSVRAAHWCSDHKGRVFFHTFSRTPLGRHRPWPQRVINQINDVYYSR